MSDLSLQLQQAFHADFPVSTSQLPVSSYFDDALYKREINQIFKNGPRYVGHQLAVPQVGDYYTLPQESGGRALVRTHSGVELISNVCRHRQALILKGRGSLPAAAGGNIICPLHRWTYAGTGAHSPSESPSESASKSAPMPAGTLLGAPHFANDPCLNLHNYPLSTWNGLLFESGHADANGQLGRNAGAELAGLQARGALDFAGYALDHVEMHVCNYNWKTFIEVYLEDYHVGPFHPGLGQLVDCNKLEWQFGKHYSVQTVGVANRLGIADAHGDGKGGSPVYQRWQEALLKYRNGVPPQAGAIWLTYYPHVMVEWYPHVLTVSTLHPMGPQKTMNMVEFYYPEEICAFEREFVESQRAAYMETCAEDDEIALRMDAGRHALMLRGDNEVGPYQSPMEDGMQQFHEWYRREMAGFGTVE